MTSQAAVPVRREHAVNLGPVGWIAVLLRATGITSGLVFKAVKASVGGSKAKNDLPFYDYMAYGGMRDYQSGLDAVGIQNLLASTAKTAVKVAKQHGIPSAELQLPDGTTVVRLGPKGAKKVAVLFHGGGYMSTLLPTHVQLGYGFADTFPDDLSVFILQYYIIVVGDSAGAHLTLGLLLHLRHPNPQVPAVEMEGNLSGAALISPWVVNMNLECESVKSNKDKDILSKTALEYWTRNFMGSSEPDYWNSLLTVPTDWWADLPVDDILMTYGDNEMLHDGAAELCKSIQASCAKAAARNFPGELHAHMLMNRFLHINKPCESEQVFHDWFQGRLSS